MKRFAAVLLLPVAAACSDGPAAPTADSASLAPVLNAESSATIPDQYIVTLQDGTDPAALAAAYGVTPLHSYEHLFSGFAATLPEAALQALRTDPRVVAIEADQVVVADRDTVSQSTVGGSWGLDRIDQRAGGTAALNGTYRYTHTGAGVRIYIVDTGIKFDHPEFLAADGTTRAGFGVDMMPDSAQQRGADCNGHGTHVAGTAGGRTYGVAKEARLIAVRVLSCAGSGSTSGVIAGLEWVAVNGRLPAVASMSIGSGIPTRSEAYDRAVRTMFESGVLLVMSAGNGWSAAGVATGIGYDSCLRSPSWIRVGITVGNANRFDEKSTSSNYGDCVDLFAPGSSIKSAWWTNQYSPDYTRTISGTSMATPHVSGVAALFLQQARGATPQQVKDGILSQVTRHVIGLSLTANNHMLYSLVQAPAELRGSNPRHDFPCTPRRQREGRC